MTLGQLLGFSEQHDFWGSYTEVGGSCPGFPVSLFTFLHDGLGAPQGETKPVPDTSQLCDLNQVILLFESVSLWGKKKNGNAIKSSLNMVDMFCDLKGNDE